MEMKREVKLRKIMNKITVQKRVGLVVAKTLLKMPDKYFGYNTVIRKKERFFLVNFLGKELMKHSSASLKEAKYIASVQLECLEEDMTKQFILGMYKKCVSK